MSETPSLSGTRAVRLSRQDVNAIKSAVLEVFGAHAGVTLFGSRTDGARRGGDIDLLIDVASGEATLDNELRLEFAIKLRLGERKVDILLAAPDCAAKSIHDAARMTGVAL